MTIFVLFSNVFQRISKRTHFALVVVVSFTYDCLRTVLNASGPLAAKNGQAILGIFARPALVDSRIGIDTGVGGLCTCPKKRALHDEPFFHPPTRSRALARAPPRTVEGPVVFRSRQRRRVVRAIVRAGLIARVPAFSR